jgi:hypothetical protein
MKHDSEHLYLQRTERLRRMTSDITSALSRLQDKRPDDFRVIMQEVYNQILLNPELAISGIRWNESLSSEAQVAKLFSSISFIAPILVTNDRVKSAIGRLLKEYSGLPVTNDIKLKQGPRDNSVADFIVALSVLTLFVAGGVLIYEGLQELEEAEKAREEEKKKNQEEYQP